MLADAIRAEGYRLLRNRMTVFWSVLFIPLLFGVGGALFHALTKGRGDEMAAEANLQLPAPAEALNLADALLFGASGAANGALLVFMLLGAATVYAGDYRWESWRLITARNSRVNLLLGKVGVMKLMALAATFAMMIAAFLFFIAQAVVYERGMVFNLTGEMAGDSALVWLLSYVRIVQYGLIALLTAVMTRSLMAALFVPWAIGFVQGLMGSPPVLGLLKLEPGDWPAQLMLPGLAYDTLKNAISPGLANAMAQADSVWPSIIGLSIWIVVPLGAALLLFKRQDLSKE